MHDTYESTGGRLYPAESDLACERRRADVELPGVEFHKEAIGSYVWERLKITGDEGARCIGRPKGHYDTLNIPKMNLLDEDMIEDCGNEIAKELCTLFDKVGICPDRLLIVGLGNGELTPDSVGPRTASKINATMHIKDVIIDAECSEIAVLTPGVMAKTGLGAHETVTALCERIDPDAIIAIDSLASRAQERLGTTIQISDTGIFPGSGIGNMQRPLNESTVGVPVIAIGVPTVINARILTDEQFDDGIVPTESMFVSPRDIDTIAEVSSKIISIGINQAFGVF